MPRLRKLFFWFFAVLYLTVCPLTVLYALGYWVMPGTGQGIVKTGLLYVSSAPPEASVYLGNQRYTKKTPTILRDLLPGEYQVKLALKHYKPWKRILPIEAERRPSWNECSCCHMDGHRSMCCRMYLKSSFRCLQRPSSC